jgi:hypothetical protein
LDGIAQFHPCLVATNGSISYRSLVFFMNFVLVNVAGVVELPGNSQLVNLQAVKFELLTIWVYCQLSHFCLPILERAKIQSYIYSLVLIVELIC